jgi:chromosome segregation and condensation protein ScpB
MLSLAEAKTVLETALLSSQEPLAIGELRKLFERRSAPIPSGASSTSCARTGRGRAWSW